jgi:hypothetical protein
VEKYKDNTIQTNKQDYLYETIKMSIILLSVIDHFHPIWTNVFFYLFLSSILVFGILLRLCMKRISEHRNEVRQLQSQHIARIDGLRKEHYTKNQSLRAEILRKEEEATRQWAESEKEAFRVLNSISEVLELSEDLSKLKTNEILLKLDDIREIIETKA